MDFDMNTTPFSTLLTTLRTEAHLSNRELARLAKVPASLVGALQSGKRRVGELQARKIAGALKLMGPQLDDFVFAAVNTCTEKVLEQSKPFPAEVINFGTRLL